MRNNISGVWDIDTGSAKNARIVEATMSTVFESRCITIDTEFMSSGCVQDVKMVMTVDSVISAALN